jgi:hypothetical protein
VSEASFRRNSKIFNHLRFKSAWNFGLERAARQASRPTGTLSCSDWNAEENVDPSPGIECHAEERNDLPLTLGRLSP